ncbi:MAG: FAD-dependent oxidoreductase [Ruminococcaceae bacterium]|nr:FAD-dependent oxidoreductase [Oscillospiraceae bacterium]
MEKCYDIAIVGGGPAGLSAALNSLRAEKSVVLIEKNNFGGQIAVTPRLENYPGIKAVSGGEFVSSLLDQVTDLGCELELASVLGVEKKDSKFEIDTDSGKIFAKSVILATGAAHKSLCLEREEELTGNGVSYCALCDGAFFKGKTVAVVGGGNTAVKEAGMLAGICNKVYIIHRRSEFRAEAANLRSLDSISNIEFLLDRCVTELHGDDELNAITVKYMPDGSEEILPIDGLFVSIGSAPQNTAFAELADTDSIGWFSSDESCKTKTSGLFVAGDCRAKSIKQVVTAVSDGAVASAFACDYLNQNN